MNILTFTDPASHEVIRTISLEGQPWFAVTDICRILGHSNPTMATNGLEPEEKMTVDAGAFALSNNEGKLLRGKQQLAFINESGLYALIFKSRKPNAVKFRLWVTSDLLPTIREKGFYSVFPEAEDAETKKLEGRVAGQMSHIRSSVEALREPLPEGYGSLKALMASFGMECLTAGERLRAANAVRQACRAQSVSVIYRWHPKDWRAVGYYPRAVAQAALVAALPENLPHPDLFEG